MQSGPAASQLSNELERSQQNERQPWKNMEHRQQPMLREPHIQRGRIREAPRHGKRHGENHRSSNYNGNSDQRQENNRDPENSDNGRFRLHAPSSLVMLQR